MRHWPVESQQPFGHDVALQTHAPLEEQAWPVAQPAHAAPPVPQVVVLGVWHWPLESQQPFGHDVALQTHAPCALQVWLVPHATHWPPLAPHAVADAVTHWPFWQQPEQLVVPQLHAPPLQVWPVEHASQALPPEPHVVADCADWAMQRCWASQHPFGQVVASQTHFPAVVSQVWPLAHAAQVAPAVPQAVVDCDA